MHFSSNVQTLIIVQLTQYINVTKSLLGTEESNLDLDEPRPVFGRRPVYAFQIQCTIISLRYRSLTGWFLLIVDSKIKRGGKGGFLVIVDFQFLGGYFSLLSTEQISQSCWQFTYKTFYIGNLPFQLKEKWKGIEGENKRFWKMTAMDRRRI